MIHATMSASHWNYFLALEADLVQVARFVEPTEANFKTYSIELARLLLAAASEADVVLKLIAKQRDTRSKADNIMQYKQVLVQNFGWLETSVVYIPRFGLHFCPWECLGGEKAPLWWQAYNNVKHRRDSKYANANLKHVLNATGGLFLLLLVHYATKDKYAQLSPVPTLFVAGTEAARVVHVADGRTVVSFENTDW